MQASGSGGRYHESDIRVKITQLFGEEPIL